MKPQIRRLASGDVVLEFLLSEHEALDLRRELGEAIGDEKPRAKPQAWIPLKDRPGMPTNAPKPPKPIRVR